MFSKFIGILFFLFFSIIVEVHAQNDSSVFASYTTSVNRSKLYSKLVTSIHKNLSVPLNTQTEGKWEDVFWAMELINYKTLWTKTRIQFAFDSLTDRSTDFQRSLLELIYTNYPNVFAGEINAFILKTSHPKVFAMAAEYLLQNNNSDTVRIFLKNLIQKKFNNITDDAILTSLSIRLQQKNNITAYKILPDILSRDFLAGNTIMYSFQRKNRDNPGIVIVRSKEGKFIREANGRIFNVPQLARSISNLPGYLTNGNTPQGIFRMYGFDVSRSSFIGPTTNIQLTMPAEATLQHFLKDSSITDSIWTIDWYKNLLPRKLKNYAQLFESFYAGKAGRTEIIAHGTAIDQEYYKSKPYYPYTPSLGCLCTREIWSTTTGKRLQSDQQKLSEALNLAGGADGYAIVIELDDKNLPININELLPFILKAESLK